MSNVQGTRNVQNYCCACSHLCSLQGGGPGSNDEEMADPFNGVRYTVCMALPMEVVTLTEIGKVVEVGSLAKIPSDAQVRRAISNLYKEKEKHPDKFVYIKFPFGLVDYAGLQMMKSYHEYISLKKRIAEERVWLKEAKNNCNGLGVNIDRITEHFKSNVWCSTTLNPATCIRNLVGKRWLTDDIIETAFETINKEHDDTICLVCKPTRFMYSSVRLRDRVQNVREKGITISRVLVAMNVGRDDDGTCYVSDEKRRGVHWALMAIDLQKNVTYYGDSLGWSLPNNLLDTVESNLKQLEGDLGIDIRFSSQNIVTINTPSPNSDPNKLLYPLQTCSDMCGVIVVCMCAVLCDHWNLWCENKVYTPLLQYPSTNSMQLRLMALSWIVNDGVDTCNLVQKMTTNDSGEINTIKYMHQH